MMRAGVSVIAGPSGGFIVGFAVMAFIVGLVGEKLGFTFKNMLLGTVLGTAACYTMGLAWFMFLTGNGLWLPCFSACSVPAGGYHKDRFGLLPDQQIPQETDRNQLIHKTVPPGNGFFIGGNMKDAVKAICRIWRPEWQGMLMGRLTYKKEMEKIERMRKSSAMGNFSAWPSAAGKAGNFLSSSFQNLLLPKKERSGPMKPPSGNHFSR